MYLFNSKIVHYVYVFFLCITSFLLDTRLVLAYMLSLMSGHNKFIMLKKKKKLIRVFFAAGAAARA